METRGVVLRISHGMIKNWWDWGIRTGRKEGRQGYAREVTSLCTCPDAQRRGPVVGVFYEDRVFAGRRDIVAAFAE
jgi:hypothetical protein